MSEPVRLNLPLDKSQLANLKAGQEVRLAGPCYTMRDAGHARALEALEQTGELPFGRCVVDHRRWQRNASASC